MFFPWKWNSRNWSAHRFISTFDLCDRTRAGESDNIRAVSSGAELATCTSQPLSKWKMPAPGTTHTHVYFPDINQRGSKSFIAPPRETFPNELPAFFWVCLTSITLAEWKTKRDFFFFSKFRKPYCSEYSWLGHHALFLWMGSTSFLLFLLTPVSFSFYVHSLLKWEKKWTESPFFPPISGLMANISWYSLTSA